ncbi:pentapeptide repeat-containing protein [Plantactinospora sp. WMMB782]|uniref:pentapeptide repeat-containing protein n=1 Tax=Plantactinospora sp. WMMB782 TaxID=3404121 RepID=UPI003B956A8E
MTRDRLAASGRPVRAGHTLGWLSTPESLTPPRLRLGWHIAGWIALAAGVAFAAGLLVWWGIGAPAHAVPVKERLELTKIALAVTGGIGGAVALVVAYRKQHFSEMEEQREEVKLSMERFSTAAQQLGDPAAAVRLAGAYAMASLADDWGAGRQTCVDVLCAYLRMFYAVDPPDQPDMQTAWHGERQVRQTIIRLISSHLRRDARIGWWGHDLDFTGAVFDDGEFDGAVFSGGRVSFRNARFIGGRVSLRGVVVSGAQVSFQDAQFVDCVVSFAESAVTAGALSFDGAEFASGEVSFADATFTGGSVDFGAIFCGSSVSFAGAHLVAGILDFEDAHFQSGLVDLRRVRSPDTLALPDSLPADPAVLRLPARQPGAGSSVRDSPGSIQ